MDEVKVRITGTRALLLHNAETLVNPFSEVNKAKKKLTAKRTNKSEDDMVEIARLEWEASWYWSATDGPVLPANCLFASFVGAAKQTRRGKMVERGVSPADIHSRIDYPGPRDLKALWGKGLEGSPFVDYRAVGQQTAKVMRCRPCIPAGWSIDTSWWVDTSTIDMEVFQQIVERAGQTEGVGDFRKMYGRFTAELI